MPACWVTSIGAGISLQQVITFEWTNQILYRPFKCLVTTIAFGGHKDVAMPCSFYAYKPVLSCSSRMPQTCCAIGPGKINDCNKRRISAFPVKDKDGLYAPIAVTAVEARKFPNVGNFS